MEKRLPYLVFCLAFGTAFSACSTTEQQVEGLIEQLAANEIDAPSWNQAVDQLILIGRPAARQLIAHIAAAHYTGENYREYREEIEKIRTGCARALGKIKPRAASAALVGTIGPDFTDPERLAGIWAVGEIGFDQASADALKKELEKEPVEDENPAIRLHVVIALIKMGEYGPADQVKMVINGEDPGLRNVALEGLEGANYFGVPLLVDIVAQESPHQGQIQDILKKVKQQLIGQLNHEDPELRGQSARALGKIGDSGTRDDLVALLEDPSNQVRFNAATSLAEMGQAEGIDFLFDALEDQDPILRANAVKFLSEVQSNSASVENQLLEALGHDNPLARSGAAQVLAQARVATALQALLQATEDSVPEVRWNAIIALGVIGSPASRARLQELLQDGDDTVAYYAKWALLQLEQG
jgi:HEAT repeat protein